MQNYNELEEFLKNKNLTREQKVEAINNYFNNYRASVDKELNDYLRKQRIGAALEIGSAALPVGLSLAAGTKPGLKFLTKVAGDKLGPQIAEKGIGGILGSKVLQKTLGNKLSETIGTGPVLGVPAGAMSGSLHGYFNDESIPKSALQGAALGFVAGGANGAIVGKTQRYLKGRELKNFGDIDNIDKTLRNKYFDASKNFYKDYNQGIKLNDIDFTKRGMQETLTWNPKQAQNFPDLINDIKNSKRLPDAPNLKPQQKPFVSHYELYEGKNGLHHIEVLKNGEKRFYITKDTLAGTPRDTIPGSNKSINNMINDFPPIFNPAQVAINNPANNNNLQKVTPNVTTRTTNTDHIGSPINSINNLSPIFNPAQVAIPEILRTDNNPELKSNHEPFQLRVENTVWDTIPMADPFKQNSNHIFTPQEIGKMSNKEFSKNEAVIMKQAKDGLIKQQSEPKNYAGYKNSVSGTSQIYSREDIGAMSGDEFNKNQDAIWSQLNSIGIPTNNELQHSSINGGGTVFVKPYKRRDGTEVKGYYRSL